MSTRTLASIVLVAVFATTLSCAVADAPDSSGPMGWDAAPPPAQSAARMGLASAYRGFYDALEGEGEWVLIEPYGWVFRPRVNFDSWRPYQQGWWEPSEAFGWVWNSTDTFGWVTDHYGSWFYDSYQGWVWQPGPVWGPAWVAWVGVGDYVGWAPLGPAGYDSYASVPSGLFTFAPAQQFGGMQSSSQASFISRPPAADAPVTEFSNFDQREGVAFNRGPGFAELRRLGGPVAPPAEEPAYRRVKMDAAPAPATADLVSRTNRLVAAGVRELKRGRVDAPAPPEADPAPATGSRERPAAPDSSVTKEPRRGGPKLDLGRPERRDPPAHRGAGRDSTKR